jgi:hypothetical protein
MEPGEPGVTGKPGVTAVFDKFACSENMFYSSDGNRCSVIPLTVVDYPMCYFDGLAIR